jgi:hypothetical protein
MELQSEQRPKLNVTSSTIAGAAVGAGLLAAVGAAAGYTVSLESLQSGADFIEKIAFTPLQGALGGAAVGAAVGGLSGYANADRLRRESELLPDRGRRESWQEREIKRRAMVAARLANGMNPDGDASVPSRA